MRHVLIPVFFGLVGIAILVSLGIWQVKRLAWKEAALAQIEAQLSQDPVEIPHSPDPVADKYRSVHASGRFDDNAVRVLSGAKHVGAGYLLVSPLTTTDGRRVLVDRGFMPLADETPAPPLGDVVVTGNLLWPDERTSSTPANDVAANIWFARDVEDMAQSFGTEPILVVARAIDPAEKNVTPVPVDTSHIPNDHLNYAITWFSLAVVWLLMTIYYIRRQAGQMRGKAT